ncbi:hypothetical protein SUGI_0275640 [Cryptomeria japonica]|uniref:probable LRR receptor-like serine/threonine-protein kinase At4g36180 n=1 Tax=Cryptomeria japonica TaxID=3369 RepID=UPI002408B3AF|nr:probable LRR receptor-like serine/threonine-protein kinase At4g36180 [Cryptomeria japonica]GLJ16320.1 hypothetical protein SUGI_0275640 [Cryptomeria japonica]
MHSWSETMMKIARHFRLGWKSIIAISVSAAVVGIFLLMLAIFFFLRYKKKVVRSEGDVGEGQEQHNLVMFYSPITYPNVLEATGQFNEEHVSSRTRYGIVFKACFEDGTVLSIRRLPDGQISEETVFREEAEALGRVKHPNLTVLRGYYVDKDVRLLAYDYMPNGNLATLLQEASHQDGHILNWPMRHLIALGLAKGLAHLHSYLDTPIVHGDVKPSNVQFDADFEAHLSDFGLDKLSVRSMDDKTVGSFGYVSPEGKLRGETTKEGDVYSFGIVLLELLTGRRAVMFIKDEEQGEDEMDIVKWVKRQLQTGQISELFDPSLLEVDPQSSEWEEFLLAVKVALLCTVMDPLDRPSMTEVVLLLEGCRVAPDLLPSSSDPTSQTSPV